MLPWFQHLFFYNFQPSTFVCVSTSGLQDNKPESVWRDYDQMPPNSSALRITAGNNGAISVQQSQLQQTHQVGDNNSEASTSPLNATNVASDGGGNNGISNNIGSQHYLTGGSENTNEMMTTLNEPPSASAMQQLNTQVIPTGSIIIKTEESDDSPIGEVMLASMSDTLLFLFSKVFVDLEISKLYFVSINS